MRQLISDIFVTEIMEKKMEQITKRYGLIRPFLHRVSRTPDAVSSMNSGKPAEDEYEICVLCGKKTNVKRMTHIDLRDCYVEGCGQLCPACWRDTYK